MRATVATVVRRSAAVPARRPRRSSRRWPGPDGRRLLGRCVLGSDGRFLGRRVLGGDRRFLDRCVVGRRPDGSSGACVVGGGRTRSSTALRPRWRPALPRAVRPRWRPVRPRTGASSAAAGVSGGRRVVARGREAGPAWPPASSGRRAGPSGAAASASARSGRPRRRTGRRSAGAAGRAASPSPAARRAGLRRGGRRDERAHGRERDRLQHGDPAVGPVDGLQRRGRGLGRAGWPARRGTAHRPSAAATTTAGRARRGRRRAPPRRRRARASAPRPAW